MANMTIEAETVLKQAAPQAHQQGHEIQPFGHLVKMPIVLAESACQEHVVAAPVGPESRP